MSDYIVSARKYRPDSFEALIGQDNIAQTLKNSIQRGQLAHAYLFCGPRGVGKTSTARIFAKTINCSNPGPDLEPCGECESCLSFQEGRSYCIHELDAASNNSVEDIRTLLEQVQIPPQVGRYSVYIIDEVHMLSTQAFNAFLKTLEEPPAHAIFILCTTEKHKILPTILSRCQTYDFNRISIPDMMRNLRDIAQKENIKVDEESLHVISQKADGAMRDALTLFDQSVAFCGTDIKYADVIRNLGVIDFEYNFRLVDAFLAGDYATALLLFDEILGKGFNALHFVGALSSHLRDLLVARTGGLEALLDQPESLKGRYREQAARCSVKFLYDALGVTGECEAGYRMSSNQRLHIEYALMRLSFLEKAPVATSAPAPAPAASAPAAKVPAAPAPATPAPVPAAKAPEAPAAPVKRPAPAPAAAPKPEPAPAPIEDAIEIIMDAPAPAAPAPAATPAPAPAPAAPAAPAATPAGPAPRRRGAAASKLASLMKDDSSAVEVEPVVPAETKAGIPQDGEITGRWKELVEKVSAGKPRLESTLSEARLEVSEGEGCKILTFEVINDAQKIWIEQKILRDLEKTYNELLGTRALRLAVKVRPAEEMEQKIYMPEEKAQDLMDKNPEVRKLVKDLALDTK